jgi:molybdopterin synthase sulfur carrier subunit
VITEITGKSSLVVDGVSSTEDLRAKLEESYPRLKTINYAIAVNKKIVTGHTPFDENATIALLPPFSGG